MSDVSAAMKSLGPDQAGRPLYWAAPGRFTVPGLYVWDEAAQKNVLLWFADTGPANFDPTVAQKHEGLPVAGYRAQNQAAVDCVNAMKVREELILRQLDGMQQDSEVDQRWLAIGRTQLEQAFMAINRSIFRPSRALFPQTAVPDTSSAASYDSFGERDPEAPQ